MKISDIITSIITIIVLIALGFVLALYFIKPEVQTVTVTEPGQIVLKPGPTPKPVIVEKIVYQDGKASFNQDVPFNQIIQTKMVDMEFSGVHHVSMADNQLSVVDEIIGEVKTTIRSKPPPELRKNHVGIVCLVNSNQLRAEYGAYWQCDFTLFSQVLAPLRIQVTTERVDISQAIEFNF